MFCVVFFPVVSPRVVFFRVVCVVYDVLHCPCCTSMFVLYVCCKYIKIKNNVLYISMLYSCAIFSMLYFCVIVLCYTFCVVFLCFFAAQNYQYKVLLPWHELDPSRILGLLIEFLATFIEINYVSSISESNRTPLIQKLLNDRSTNAPTTGAITAQTIIIQLLGFLGHCVKLLCHIFVSNFLYHIFVLYFFILYIFIFY